MSKITNLKKYLRNILLIIFVLLLSNNKIFSQNNEYHNTGTADNGINAGDIDVTGNKITIEALVTLENTTDARTIVGKHSNATNANYTLRASGLTVTIGGVLIIVNNPITFLINVQYHIAAVYDGANIYLYVNGCEVAKTAATGNLAQNNFGTIIGNMPTANQKMTGYLDEVRIWNVARTANQLKSNMFNLSSPTTQSGLLLYYDFDNFNGALVKNMQGNTAFDGTSYGTITYDPNPLTVLPSITSDTINSSCIDTDLDGIFNDKDIDDDNDGILDSKEGASDFDGDGIVNQFDFDSDGDGCSDAYEGGSTSNLTSNYVFNSNVGINGFADTLETTIDNGVINYIEIYSSAIDNNSKRCIDYDIDGVADSIDLDDDGDGIMDDDESFCEKMRYVNENTVLINGNFQVKGSFRGTMDFAQTDIGFNHTSTASGGSNNAGYSLEANGTKTPYIRNYDVDKNFKEIYEFNPKNSTGKMKQVSWGTFNFYAKNWPFTTVNNLSENITLTWTGGFQAVVRDPFNRITNYAHGDIISSGAVLKIITTAAKNASWNIDFLTNYSTDKFTLTAIHNLVNASNYWSQLYGMYVIGCTDSDIDNDGFYNSIDVDSDGDACPDYYEAGYFPDKYIISSNLSQFNIVGANGFTDILEHSDTDTASYKYKNDYLQVALNPKTNLCDDYDNDGVPDAYDLDDDNDGITDEAECRFTLSRDDIASIKQSPTKFTIDGIELSVEFGPGGLFNPDPNPVPKYVVPIDGAHREIKYKFSEPISYYSTCFYDMDRLNASQWETMTVDVYYQGQETFLNSNEILTGEDIQWLENNTFESQFNSGTFEQFENQRFCITIKRPFDSIIFGVEAHNLGCCFGFDYPTFETNKDSDGDGLPACYDYDTDDDGCPDVLESGHNYPMQIDSTVAGPFDFNGLFNNVQTDTSYDSKWNYTVNTDWEDSNYIVCYNKDTIDTVVNIGDLINFINDTHFFGVRTGESVFIDNVSSKILSYDTATNTMSYNITKDFTVDTIFVRNCDTRGNCDSIWIRLARSGMSDTIPKVIRRDSSLTICTDEFWPYDPDTTYLCTTNSLNGTTTIVPDSCIKYTPNPSFTGYDTTCFISCKDGICDTNYVTFKVIPPIDTIKFTMHADSIKQICVDNSQLPGTPTTMTSCGDGIQLKTTLNNASYCVTIDPVLGAVGNDELCVIVCDDTGFCDTTIIIPYILPGDTILLRKPGYQTSQYCHDTTGINEIIASTSACSPTNRGNSLNVVSPSLCFDIAPQVGNYYGIDSTCIVLCDPLNNCDTVVVFIKFYPPKDTLIDTINENDSLIKCFDTNELPGKVLSVTSCGNPFNGTITTQNLNCFTYKLDSAFIGKDSMCFITCDDQGFCDTTYQIIVVRPKIDTIQTVVIEDSNVVICDTDIYSLSVDSVKLCNLATNGLANINGTCVTYNVNDNYVGVDTICIIACNDGICDTNILPIKIIPVVDTFVDTINEDDSLITCFDKLNTNASIDSIKLCDGGNYGTTTLNSTTNCFTYKPQMEYFGNDTVCYIVCNDGQCDTSIGIITINPITDTTLIINVEDSSVIFCDTNVPNIYMSPCSEFDEGSVLNLVNGCIKYTPIKNYVGNDTVCYVVCNDNNICDTTVVIAINQWRPDTISRYIHEDSTLTFCDSLLINTNADSVKVCDGGKEGITSISGSCFTYSPNTQGFNDTLCLVSCNDGICDSFTVLIRIIHEIDTLLNVTEDSLKTECYDSIIYVDDTSFALIDSVKLCPPLHGTSITNPNSSLCIDYKADSNYVGYDTSCIIACYSVDSNGIAICDTTELIIIVNPVTDTVYDTLNSTDSVVLCDTTLIKNNSTSMSVCTANNGTLTVSGTCATYKPNSGFSGNDTTCIVSCVDTLCDTTILIVTVLPSLTTIDTIIDTVSYNASKIICFDTSELQGTILNSINTCGNPDSGTFVTMDSNCVEFKPNNGFTGRDTSCILICDNLGICDTTYLITVVLPPIDTESVVIPMDSNITHCVDTSELPGKVVSIATCGNPMNGTTTNFALNCVKITPSAGYTGYDTTCVVVCDDQGLCDTTIILIKVVPTIDTESVVIPMDSNFTHCVDTSELPGKVVSIATCGNPMNGATSNFALNCVKITPSAGFTGFDTTCVVVCDDQGFCDTTIILIKVVPTIDTESVVIPMDSNLTHCVDTSELPGKVVSIATCGNPMNGTSSNFALNCVKITPSAGFTGFDTTCVVVCDDQGFCDTTIILIKVVPTIDTESVVIPMDSNLIHCVDTSELPGKVVSIATCGNPMNGATSNFALNCVKITPSAGFTGFDTTCVVVCDDQGFCDTTIILIKVVPTIDTESVVIPMDSNLIHCVDTSELPGKVVSIATCGNPMNGATSNFALNCVKITPSSGFTGNDTTCVVVCDDQGFCDTTIILIKVVPTLDTESVVIPMDSNITHCVDTSELPGKVVSIATCGNPMNGTTTNFALNCVKITPSAGYTGYDTTCVVVCDDQGLCDTTIILIKVVPTIDTESVVIPMDSNLIHCVDTSELPGKVVSIATCGNPMNGTTTNFALNCVKITPSSGFTGNDTTCIVVCDDQGFCDTTIILIKVVPTIDTESVVIPMDSNFTHCVDTSELPGKVVSIATCGNPMNGTTTNFALNCVKITPSAGYTGYDTTCVVVCDDQGFCDTTIILIKVVPTIDTESVVIPMDSNITHCVDTSELPGKVVSIATCGNPMNGTSSNFALNCVKITPSAGYTGYDTTCVVVCDDQGFCDTTIILIKVVPTIDTESVVIPMDSNLIHCVDTSELPGKVVSIATCGNPMNGATSNFALNCVKITPSAGFTGFDTTCVVVCDDQGFCDTTIILIKVVPTIDTESVVIPMDSNLTHCVDTSELLGKVVSIATCGNPMNGATSNFALNCVKITPSAGYTGYDTTCVVVCDDQGFCDTTIILIKVVPTIDTESVVIPMDSNITHCVDTSELPGKVVSIATCGNPMNGTTTNFALNCVKITPSAGFTGFDTTCVVVCDDQGFCDTTIILIKVVPTIDTESVVIPMDSNITHCVDTSELPGKVVSIATCGNPMNGTTTNFALNCVKITPSSGFTGNDTTCVVVCDEQGFCDTTIILIKVVPTIDTESVVIPIDSNITHCVDTSELPGKVVSIVTCGNPMNGTTTNFALNCVKITPSAGFTGFDTTCVVVCDDQGFCDTTIIIITVIPVIDTIRTVTLLDTPKAVCVDTSELIGNLVSIASCDNPDNGAFTSMSGHCIVYTPNSGYIGSDTSCIVICDNLGFCDTTILIIDIVLPIYFPPKDTVVITSPMDSIITVCKDTLDLIGKVTSYSTCNGTDPMSNASISNNGDNCFDITPNNEFVGKDTTCIIVCDIYDFCDTTVVFINIYPPRDTESVVIPMDSNLIHCVDTSELPGNVVSIATCGNPMNGATSNFALNCVKITPSAGFTGNDTTCVIVCDDQGFCDTTIILIKVVPTIDTESVVIPMDSNLTHCVDTSELPGKVVSIVTCGNPMNGATSNFALNCVKITPSTGFTGYDTTCVVVCDDQGFCDTTIILIKVVPTIDTESVVIPMDSNLTHCVDTSELPGKVVSIVTCGNPMNGATSNFALNCVEITPSAGFTGNDTTCVVVCDDKGFCDTTIILIKVIPTIDTESVVIPMDSNLTHCVDTSELPGKVVSIVTCGNPMNGTTTNFALNCVKITPSSGFTGFDTTCVIVCDDQGFCDTTIILIKVVPTIDTESVVIPMDSNITHCVDTSELPGKVISIVTCGNPMNGATSNFALNCVEITPSAGFTGFDTTCVVVCDDQGFCDTTIIIITVIPVIDTIRTVTLLDTPKAVCVDTSELIGNLVSIASCDNPDNGAFTSMSGHCIVYTPNSGYIGSDTSCIVICDNLGFCDTTILIIDIVLPTYLPPKDTLVITSPMDSIITVCKDTLDLIGKVTSYSTCNGTDPMSNATISNNGDNCFDITPNSGFVGKDTTCIIVCDIYGFCDTTVVFINIYPPRDTESVVIPMDSNLIHCVDTSELPGKVVSIATCGNPMNGATSNFALNCVKITPNAGFTGNDTTCVIVCDDLGFCDTTIILIKVVPTIDTEIVVIPMDSNITHCVDTNELPGKVVSIATCGNPMNGTSSNFALNCVKITPIAGFTGNDTTCVVVCDDQGFCDTTIILIKVVPTIDTESVVIPMDSNLTHCVDTSELPGKVVSIATCGNPMNGATSNFALNCVKITPSVGFTGFDTTCVVVCDDQGFCDTTIILIKVVPTIDTESVVIPMDSNITHCVDTSELPGNVVSIATCGNPMNGSTSNFALNCVKITPSSGFIGYDTTCVVVCDDLGFCDTTIILIKVVPPIDTIDTIMPKDDTITVCIDTTQLAGIVQSISSCGEFSNGMTINFTNNKCFDIVPNKGFRGNDTACIVVCDNIGICDTTIITLKVIPPPVDTVYDTIRNIDTLTLCVDTSELPFKTIDPASKCGDASNGIFTISNNNCFQYVPNNGYVGNDSMCILVCDTAGFCDTTFIFLVILPTRDTIFDTLPEDSNITLCIDTTKLPGNIVSITYCDSTNNGSLINNNDGCLDYTPNNNFVGNDTACVIICDNLMYCDTTIVILTITPIVDTIIDTLQTTDSVTYCLNDLDSQFADTIYSCNANYGTNNINGNCVVYKPNVDKDNIDTTCIVICNDGLCDTTIVIHNIIDCDIIEDTSDDVIAENCDSAEVCLPVNPSLLLSIVNSDNDDISFSGCDGDTVVRYGLLGGILNNEIAIEPYNIVTWVTPNGIYNSTSVFNTRTELINWMNTVDPNGNWVDNNGVIFGGDQSNTLSNYGIMHLSGATIDDYPQINILIKGFKGTKVQLPMGGQWIYFNLKNGCIDSTYIDVNCKPNIVCNDLVNIYIDTNGIVDIDTNDVVNSISVFGNYNLNVLNNNFDCDDLSDTVSIQVVITNSIGLSDTCTARAIILDTIDPNPKCNQEVELVLDENGQVVITTDILSNNSDDNCDLNSIELSQSVFDCDEIGIDTVIITATDNSGNTATCEATVNIVDMTSPDVFCITSDTALAPRIDCIIEIEDYINQINYSDNCNIDNAIYKQTPAAGTSINVKDGKIIPINIEITDASGNSNQCSFNLHASCDNSLVIPQFISNDKNNKNDKWFIKGIEKYEATSNVKVFNRWGNLVFDKDHYLNDWDGKPNVDVNINQLLGSNILPNGTYFYIIDLGVDNIEPFTGYLEITN